MAWAGINLSKGWFLFNFRIELKMKVRFVGLSIKSGDGVNASDFLDYLISQNGISIEYNDYERRCYVEKTANEKYYIGLFLTIKDQKKFCELRDNGTVAVGTLADGSSLMDFNFFVINKSNGFCMYQHYHQSCSANQFGAFLKQRFRTLQDQSSKNEKDQKSTLTKKDEQKINSKYSKSLSWDLIVRPEKIDAILAELDTIQTFVIDFSYLVETESPFVPMKNYVSKERKSFVFASKTPASVLTPVLKDIISLYDISHGNVKGKDFDGIEKIIKISENPDNFGEYEHDYVVGKLDSLDLNKFYDNWVVTELLSKIEEFKHIFNAKNKP